MTDEEFQALLYEVNRTEDGTATMAEGLDLASRAVEGGEKDDGENNSEGLAERPVDEVGTLGQNSKPKRVSQRCLGKWASSKAKVNTAADTVEILSEEEGTTPTKPGEGSLPATDLEDTAVATEAVSQTPSDQGEETTQMAEGSDLASAPAGHVEPRTEGTRISTETRPSATDQPSKHAEKELEDERDSDEDRYRAERKRKGKEHRREQSDSEYAVSEESESDSDISLENEEYSEQQLPHDHRELSGGGDRIGVAEQRTGNSP
ncbi:uncharacterized protein LOC121784243 [Salvia splendens]|uniref:uncharacterized protein LOC121784243 n=1 Tax=Salvia splendens TaxID=180675 RepID=UPI001C2547D8|nr:uncharacterized protein LOC121784243 [Salvia splendens]